MMTKLVPKLRFSGFSGEWEEKELKDIALLTSSKRIYLSDYVSNGIPFYRGQEVSKLKTNNTIDNLLYIKESKYIEIKEKYGVPEKNNILITAVGTLGNILRIKDNKAFYFKDGNLIWLKNIKINSYFLEYLLAYEKNKILNSAIGSSQKALTMVSLNKILLNFPKEQQEQQKIANCLSSLDNLIEVQNKKVEVLAKYKKGLIQKLFPTNDEKIPKLRFKGFSKIWKLQTFSNLVNRYDNLRIPITASDRIKGVTPYYGANGIQDYVDGYTHNGEFILVAEDGANDLHNYPVQYVNGKIWVNNHAHVLQAKRNIANNIFLLYLIKNINIEPYLVGGGRAKLNSNIMMKISCLIPKPKEQQKIADCLSSLDNLIEVQNKNIQILKTHKKGLMQQLFVSENK
jgi:type I restriction enzyme S subunit